jgi:hypothetical protein
MRILDMHILINFQIKLIKINFQKFRLIFLYFLNYFKIICHLFFVNGSRDIFIVNIFILRMIMIDQYLKNNLLHYFLRYLKQTASPPWS